MTRSGVEVDTPCILLNDGVLLDRWRREVLEFLSATIFPLGGDITSITRTGWEMLSSLSPTGWQVTDMSG
jgi:hypothetical protein